MINIKYITKTQNNQNQNQYQNQYHFHIKININQYQNQLIPVSISINSFLTVSLGKKEGGIFLNDFLGDMFVSFEGKGGRGREWSLPGCPPCCPLLRLLGPELGRGEAFFEPVLLVDVGANVTLSL